ncbi:MAG TPA: hypothetical protein PLE19_15130 [Planctomycetota bacterium]|nr:hypothetical protein [Planctomycetota bacterium]HRR81901.1 hypothetical protein [Planctomycetota bacterium]HRT93708.1 hypothetical protein [Planctomycetota bacterium]
MAQRISGVLLALAGLLVIGALVAWGVDTHRAATSGPRWRRRLVTAGLAVLAALGAYGCDSGAGVPRPVADQAAANDVPLPDTPEWKHIETTWREASEVASGKRGPYPFDRAGKEKLLAALKAAVAGVEALQQRAALSDAAAGLLKQDLALLERGVQENRPTEMKMATCYAPMPFRPVEDSLKRLADRLPLLEKLAAAGKVPRQVIGKVIATVERDITTLGDEKLLAGLVEPDRQRAEETRKAAADLVAKLKAAMGD